MLYRKLRQKHVPIGDEKLPINIKKIVFCAALMAAVTLSLTHYVWDKVTFTSIPQEIIGLSGLIGLSGISYAAVLSVTNIMRWKDLKALRNRG
jgi:peptidoglycan biosynthesis protein MviN/MurJ (putative lipid II flippase)